MGNVYERGWIRLGKVKDDKIRLDLVWRGEVK